MRTVFYFFSLFFLISCAKPSEIRRQLSGADSLVINFNRPSSDLIEKTVNTTETKAIGQLIRFVDAKTIEARHCPFNGNLAFYREGTLKGDVAFHYSIDSCRQFVILLNGQPRAMAMSHEAADFLQSLSEGKNWY